MGLGNCRITRAHSEPIQHQDCQPENSHGRLSITRNMGQDGDGHAHFDQIWRPNITINYTGVDQNIKF